MQRPSRLVQLATCILAFSLTAPVSPWPGTRSPVQLAKSGRSSKNSDSDDRGAADDTWSHSSSVKVRGRLKFNSNGYDPQRVKRFWRHYHGARPEEKGKRRQVQR